MPDNALAQQMRHVDIFSDLTNEQLVLITFYMRQKIFNDGDIIAKKGKNCNTAIIIANGNFTCTEGIGKGKQFLEDQSGTVIGEMAMFIDDFDHPSTFIATGCVKALLIDRATMIKLMESDQDLTTRFIGKISSRLSEVTSAVNEIEKLLQSHDKNAIKAAA